MPVHFHESTKTFHLFNGKISYIFTIAKNGMPVQLYYGKRLPDKEDYSYLLELYARPMSVNPYFDDKTFAVEHIRQEYPSPFAGDMRTPSIVAAQNNGSRIVEFVYDHFEIKNGKPALKNLPACYCIDEKEAQTLYLYLKDEVLNTWLCLIYTIYENRNVICRSANITNYSKETFVLESMLSANVDLPDDDYEMLTLAGAWARERNIECHKLHPGIQSVYSLRGHSSHNFNPFLCLKRKETTENTGEAYGFSLVYSGNFQALADVDTYHTTRVAIGIHPASFRWPLKPEETFQTPEALLVYSDLGLNDMSQTFHSLFRERLCRGFWKDRVRPILLNSWEGVYFDIQENKILEMAQKSKELGVELFVLDDGWFKNRNDDTSSLGDWSADLTKLPHGIEGLAEKINEMGLEFGLWFEPEMISKNSDLYKEHPEWVLHTPNRNISVGRNQYVLDFSNPEVVDAIFKQMKKVLDCNRIAYIKWDMNRSLSEVYSSYWPQEEQGTIYHRFILGVYSLYEKLIEAYPHILFESCAAGGARFDPGMLYYAPQAWTSDDTDAVERLKIQYGTSMLYPISSMGSHVSAAPNHQLHRNTPLNTRANVAYFGTFGYELDPCKLSDEESIQIKEQIQWMKKYRKLIQFGTFYRLKSPFIGKETAWMIVSDDKKTAIIGYYRPLQEINSVYRRLKLQGLDPSFEYNISSADRPLFGQELMNAGLVISDYSASENNDGSNEGDYLSRIYVLNAVS